MTEQAVKRIKKQIAIHYTLQALLLVLFVFMAYKFQQVFIAKGMSQIFYNSLLTALVLQGILFYPIYRYSLAEAKRSFEEQESSDPVRLKELRGKRIYADFMKGVIFIFYATFIYLSPPATFFLSTAFFSFIATALTYLQSFNIAAQRIIAPAAAGISARQR